jgi:hypothetical protein
MTKQLRRARTILSGKLFVMIQVATLTRKNGSLLFKIMEFPFPLVADVRKDTDVPEIKLRGLVKLLCKYKDLNDLATMLYDIYVSKDKYFSITLRRRTDGIATIMGWIVEKRDRDIMSFKSITPDTVPRRETFDTVKSWNTMKDDDMVYLMDQKSILLEAFSVWGNRAQKVLPNGPNDYVRLIAVMLHPDNRDRMDVINDNIKQRADLDDPSRSKKFVFNEFAQQFSSDAVYSHPKSGTI